MDESKKLKSSKFYFDELQSYNARINEESVAMRTVVGDWEDMGPTYWNATSGWNPGVGRITSIAVDNANVNHIIAGGETGGVWKSLDGGLTWSVLTDNLANIDVYALAIDPTNSSTYYWGSTGGAIYKSSNGGATWTLQGSLPGGTVNKILIDPTNTSKLYCSAQGGGLFKSNNGGLSWTRIHNEATNGYDIEFKPGNTNVIYASGSKFFKSTDGGLTFTTANGLGSWTQEFVSGTNLWTTSAANQNNTVGPRTGNALALFYIGNFSGPVTRLITPSLNLSGAISPQVKFSYTQVNWAGDIDELKVLYKTSLSGNWIELANYTSEVTNWTDITIDLPNPTGDYFVAFEGKSNYGRGLTLDDIAIETSNSGIVFFDGFENAPNEFASGAKMIGVSPDDPEIVYVVEETNSRFGGFHKSTDSGENFSKLLHVQNYFGYSSLGADSNGQAPRDMDIAVHPENVNDVHIAGINTWRSTNGGVSFTITSQWTPFGASSENIGYCHADVDIMQFVGSGANTTLLVGTDGGIFQSFKPSGSQQ